MEKLDDTGDGDLQKRQRPVPSNGALLASGTCVNGMDGPEIALLTATPRRRRCHRRVTRTTRACRRCTGRAAGRRCPLRCDRSRDRSCWRRRTPGCLSCSRCWGSWWAPGRMPELQATRLSSEPAASPVCRHARTSTRTASRCTSGTPGEKATSGSGTWPGRSPHGGSSWANEKRDSDSSSGGGHLTFVTRQLHVAADGTIFAPDGNDLRRVGSLTEGLSALVPGATRVPVNGSASHDRPAVLKEEIEEV